MVFYIIQMYVYMGFILWVESHDFIHCIYEEFVFVEKINVVTKNSMYKIKIKFV